MESTSSSFFTSILSTIVFFCPRLKSFFLNNSFSKSSTQYMHKMFHVGRDVSIQQDTYGTRLESLINTPILWFYMTLPLTLTIWMNFLCLNLDSKLSNWLQLFYINKLSCNGLTINLNMGCRVLHNMHPTIKHQWLLSNSTLFTYLTLTSLDKQESIT